MKPADPNALVPHLWSLTAHKNDAGELTVGGMSLPDLVANGAPRVRAGRGGLPARARAFRDAFTSFEIFYASKAFCSAAVIRWVAEEGLSIDVCSAGELAVALKAGVPPDRIGLHGNNKTDAELRQAIDLGLRRVVVDSFDEIARLRTLTADRPRPAVAGDGAGDRGGRGAHARVHRHRA